MYVIVSLKNEPIELVTGALGARGRSAYSVPNTDTIAVIKTANKFDHQGVGSGDVGILFNSNTCFIDL